MDRWQGGEIKKNATLAILVFRSVTKKHNPHESQPSKTYRKGRDRATSVIRGREKTQIVLKKAPLSNLTSN
jgi:hypothetical protein